MDESTLAKLPPTFACLRLHRVSTYPRSLNPRCARILLPLPRPLAPHFMGGQVRPLLADDRLPQSSMADHSYTPAGIPMRRPRRSACATRSRERELARFRNLSVEERIVAALSMGTRFAWLKPTPAPVSRPDDLLRAAEEVFGILARHHLDAQVQPYRTNTVP